MLKKNAKCALGNIQPEPVSHFFEACGIAKPSMEVPGDRLFKSLGNVSRVAGDELNPSSDEDPFSSDECVTASDRSNGTDQTRRPTLTCSRVSH